MKVSGLRILMIAVLNFASMALCAGPVRDLPADIFLTIAPNLNDVELMNLGLATKSYWSMADMARDVLHDRRLWYAMFKPGVTRNVVRQFFLTEHEVYRELNDQWAGSIMSLTRKVPARNRIMFLDCLASDIDLPDDEFVSRWERVLFQWNLPAGFAIGTLIRNFALGLKQRDDRRCRLALAALQPLLGRGARFSSHLVPPAGPVDVIQPQLPRQTIIEFGQLITVLRNYKFREVDIVSVVRNAVNPKLAIAFGGRQLAYQLTLDEGAVERGFDINGKDPETGLPWFDVHMKILETHPHRLKTILLLRRIDLFGIDFERIMAERTDKLARETKLNDRAREQQVRDLIDILKLASDPTETFVNLWGKYFHMMTMPTKILNCVLTPQLKKAYATPFIVSTWAHDVAVRLLRLQIPVSHLRNLLKFMDPGEALISGKGASILREYDMCINENPLDDLNALVANASNDDLRQALQDTDPISGRTLLHQHCLTVDVLNWIGDRADPQWVRDTLVSQTSSRAFGNCLDFWLVDKHGCMGYDGDIMNLLSWFRNATGLVSETAVSVVFKHCSLRTLTFLHLSRRIVRTLYALSTKTKKLIDDIAQSRCTEAIRHRPGIVVPLLVHWLTTACPATYRFIMTALTANAGILLTAQLLPAARFTPLHVATAIPSLHEHVATITEAAIQMRELNVLSAKDAFGRTFFHVAAQSWAHSQTSSCYRQDGYAFKQVLTNTLQCLLNRTSLDAVTALVTIHDAIDGTGWTVLQRMRAALDHESEDESDHHSAFLHRLMQDASLQTSGLAGGN